jgi:hypothetical protein
MYDSGNTKALSREELEARFGRVWTAKELAKEFVVTAIIPPTVVVRCRADNVVGSMELQGDLYFNFQPERTE